MLFKNHVNQNSVGKKNFFLSMSVHYRMFAVTPHMEPIERDDANKAQTSVVVEIVVLYLFLSTP